MEEKKNKGKLFRNLFISYIMILFIPVLLLTNISYIKIEKFFKEEINKTNLISLNALGEQIEKTIENTKSNILYIAINPLIQEICSMQKAGATNNYAYSQKINELLSLFNYKKMENKSIQSIYMYNEDANIMITSRGDVTTLGNFYDTGWIKFYKKNRLDVTILPVRKPINSKMGRYISERGEVGRSVISFIYPLELLPTLQTSGAIVVNVYEEALTPKKIGEQLEYNSDFDIINERGQVISSYLYREDDIKPQYLQAILNAKEEEDYFQYAIDDVEYIVSYKKGNLSNCIYIKTTSLSHLTKTIRDLSIFLLLITLGILVVGLYVAYRATKKIYSPIGMMLNKLNINLPQITDKKQNELEIINDCVNNLVQKDKKICELLEKSEGNLKESNVLGYISGKINENEVLFVEKADEYVCMICSIDNYYELSRQCTIKQQYEYKLHIEKIISDVVQQIDQVESGIAIMEDDKIVIVLSSKQPKHMVDVIEEFIGKLNEYIFQNEKMKTSVIIGNVYVKKENLHESYKDAVEAMNYRMSINSGGVLYRDEIDDKLISGQLAKNRHVAEIVDYVRKNDINGAKEVIDKMINEVKAKGILSNDEINIYFMPFIIAINNYLDNCGMSITEVLGYDCNLFKEIILQNTIEGIQHFLNHIVEAILNYQSKEQLKDNEYIVKLKEIVDTYYMDANLDISWVANEMGLSYSYVRKIFKEQFGINFIQYLNSKRIMEAKKYLKDTHLTMKEVAIKVGYNNEQSFNRFFKKFEGIPPGEYKKNI